MNLKIILVIFLGSVALARADDKIFGAQQSLKDQGFYYGEVNGEKNADTAAAIRRYQIRNGLQVTGELDNETMRALGASAPEQVQPAAKVSPPPRPNASEPGDESSRETEPEPEQRLQPFSAGPRDNDNGRRPAEPFANGPAGPRVFPSSPVTIVPPAGGLFAGTPYATAAPEVQRDVVATAQRILERRDLYRGDIDGIYGPNLEFSLRAYQARIGLPVTGRLDLETLAGLNLLPGARMPGFVPRRPIVRPHSEPPVVGEWIRE